MAVGKSRQPLIDPLHLLWGRLQPASLVQINRTDHSTVRRYGCTLRALGVREIYLASAQINWADHTSPTAIEDVGVDHRGLHVGMTQQFLDCTNVIPRFEQMGCE